MVSGIVSYPSDNNGGSLVEKQVKTKKRKVHNVVFHKKWCAEFDFVRPDHENKLAFWCIPCRKSVSLKHQGIADIKWHAKATAHIANADSLAKPVSNTNPKIF